MGSGSNKPLATPSYVLKETPTITQLPFQGDADLCRQHLSSLTDIQLDHFKKYYVGSETIDLGDGRIVQQTTTPRKNLTRVSTDIDDVPVYVFQFGSKALPGIFIQDPAGDLYKYLAVSITFLPGYDYQGMSMEGNMSTTIGLRPQSITATGSLCPGDFRPPSEISNNPYVATYDQCHDIIRATHTQAFAMKNFRSHATLCRASLTKPSYFNISFSMLHEEDPTSYILPPSPSTKPYAGNSITLTPLRPGGPRIDLHPGGGN